MELVWEANTAEFSSRKRAAKACEVCAKNKKRCLHTFTRLPQNPAESNIPDAVSPSSSSTVAGFESTSRDAEQVPRTTPQATYDAENASQAGIPSGHIDEPPTHANEPSIKRSAFGGVCGREVDPITETSQDKLVEVQRSYLRAVGALRILPKPTQDALVTTFIACINGLLPIFDSGKLLRLYSSGKASRFLILAICLSACKSQQAVPYLRVTEDGPLLNPIQFARTIYVGLDAAMKADLEPDRVTKIQILALMHLHNDGTYGIEQSSVHLSQALQLAWGMKLHFQGPGRTPTDELSMLWWSLWSLDRFSACISCKPIMIMDRDIQLPRPPLGSDYQLQVMAIWLRLGDLLGEVFDLYRPPVAQNQTEWRDQFISFSELTGDLGASTFQTSHWTVLELCFQVVAILSCRCSKPGSVSYKRRIAACDRIQTLMSDNRHAQLPLLPVVPYAATLSLTGALCVFRDNQKDKRSAHKDVIARCQILDNLRSSWSNADMASKLGRVALRSLQQPSARMQDFTNLLIGIDADTTPCENDITHQRVGVAKSTSDGMLTSGNCTGEDLNTRNLVTEGSMQPLPNLSQTQQISDTARDFRPEVSIGNIEGIYPNQTNLQPISPGFRAATVGYDSPNLIGDTENTQEFGDLTFLEGFFELGMPTSLQDVISDGTLFLNEVFDDSGDSQVYMRQLRDF
ncbi:hypothetical protein BP6252_10997 [Coleophoma cylindrospora]|uniref:Xylanolytic transcriptional activator regulatory domain-containing protein n=1 Tax=Coleophoma cylindrospora TaxID=1849047 RepID=A0A3D8QNS8_9HELO|nr:hypothetical protein BP6252_10997 [Coleophoma cylindrospora]